MVEWDHLRIVLAIHRSGSMAAAALSLNIDRATVLRRLDALENSLKSRLFDRRSDGCSLTEAGRGIIEQVIGVEHAMTALSYRVEGEDRRAEGTVRLAAPEFLLEHIVAPAIPALRKLYPGLTLDLLTDHASLDMARGEADVAIRFRRPVNDALVARRVGTAAVGLFAARSYLEARGAPPGGDLTGHDVLLLEGAFLQMPAMGWLLPQMGNVRVAARCNEVVPLLRAVRAGAGIACLPVIAAHGDEALAAVPPGIVGRCDVYLATHRDLRGRARVRAVFDFIVRLFGQKAALLSGGEGGGPAAEFAG